MKVDFENFVLNLKFKCVFFVKLSFLSFKFNKNFRMNRIYPVPHQTLKPLVRQIKGNLNQMFVKTFPISL